MSSENETPVTIRELGEVCALRFDSIEEQLEELQQAASKNGMNQARFALEHERMMDQIETGLASINKVLLNMTIQVRDLRDMLTKQLEGENAREES